MRGIHRAAPSDAAEVAALVECAYAPWVPVIGRRPMPMDDDYAARCAAGQVWCVRRDGALAGLVVLEDAPDHLWLDNIAVAPERHGTGLGRELLGFVEAEARRRGYAELRLLTNALMLRNIEMYRRHGFTELERRGERGMVRVYMGKQLPPV